jgi:hypothetical protein
VLRRQKEQATVEKESIAAKVERRVKDIQVGSSVPCYSTLASRVTQTCYLWYSRFQPVCYKGCTMLSESQLQPPRGTLRKAQCLIAQPCTALLCRSLFFLGSRTVNAGLTLCCHVP